MELKKRNRHKSTHMVDGFHTIADIAEESGSPEREIQKIMNNLDKLELLSFVEIK